MRFAVPVMLVALEAAPPPDAGRSPPLLLCVRTEAGPGDALAGRGGTLYRAQPEAVAGFRMDRVDVFAGGGLGPAYLVHPSRGGAFTISASAALGVSFPAGGSFVGMLGRAEVVAGGGAAVTLHVGLRFD